MNVFVQLEENIRPLAIGHKAMGHKAAFCNNPVIAKSHVIAKQARKFLGPITNLNVSPDPF